MTILIASLLAMGVLTLILVIAAIVVYKIKIKRLYLYHLAAAINRFPSRLRLKKQFPLAWQKAERAQQRVAEFQAAGFAQLSGFSINELSSARMLVLRHPENGLVGLVNEMDELGTWSDVILFCADGSQPVLASSILKASHFRFLPGDPRIHKPDASVCELSKAVLTSAGPSVVISHVTEDNFATLFEQAFANASDTRLLTALDDREIKKLVKERGRICGDDISDKELDGIKKLLPLAIENELRITCGSQFLSEATIPASEWQHATERLLIVHDRTPIRNLASKLIYGVFLTSDMKCRLRKAKQTGNPRADFAHFNENHPAWIRYKKLGEVRLPVNADIYRAPIEN